MGKLGLTLAGLALAAMSYCTVDGHIYRTKYEGSIGDCEVKYSERWIGANKMEIKKDGKMYKLKSYGSGGSGIMAEIQNSKVDENDKLEKIVISEGKSKEVFEASYKYNADQKSYGYTKESFDQTLHGRQKKEIFEKCNELYTRIKSKIRDILRQRLEQKHAETVESIPCCDQ